jgi:hypothetical protein
MAFTGVFLKRETLLEWRREVVQIIEEEEKLRKMLADTTEGYSKSIEFIDKLIKKYRSM